MKNIVLLVSLLIVLNSCMSLLGHRLPEKYEFKSSRIYLLDKQTTTNKIEEWFLKNNIGSFDIDSNTGSFKADIKVSDEIQKLVYEVWAGKVINRPIADCGMTSNILKSPFRARIIVRLKENETTTEVFVHIDYYECTPTTAGLCNCNSNGTLEKELLQFIGQ